MEPFHRREKSRRGTLLWCCCVCLMSNQRNRQVLKCLSCSVFPSGCSLFSVLCFPFPTGRFPFSAALNKNLQSRFAIFDFRFSIPGIWSVAVFHFPRPCPFPSIQFRKAAAGTAGTPREHSKNSISITQQTTNILHEYRR